MLSREDNELLTQTGPGTPMGEFMRRFWTPLALSEELPGPDSDPIRLRILGEDLVAFRDTNGRVGLVDEHCPHRRASLFFGRNEECGIRCIYHGWKFDVTGKCVDLPSEPEGSPMQAKVKLKAYPTQEKGGMVFAYMGPAGTQGELPAFEFLDLPADHTVITRWTQENNYFQSVEGDFDSAHVSFLHRTLEINKAEKTTSLGGEYFQADRSPVWKIDRKPYGLVAAAARDLGNGKSYWRMNQYLFPYFAMISPATLDGPRNGGIWVPRDDESVNAYRFTYRVQRPLTAAEQHQRRVEGLSHAPTMPGSHRMQANRENDYLIDRNVQRTQNYSGMRNTREQDAAMSESAGSIADRSREYLGTSDTAIINIRKALIESAKALAEGRELEAFKGGRLFAVRSGFVITDQGKTYDQDPEAVRQMTVEEAPRTAAAE